MTHHNKLVRDKIPEICRSAGQTPHTRILSDDEYIAALEAKLAEEVTEFHADHAPEELADILEVIYALANIRGLTADELHELCANKRAVRGGFAEKIFLISTEKTKEELP